MTGSRLHKVKAVSDHFQVTTRSVYQWIRDGKLEAVRVSGRLRVPDDAIHKMMKPALDRKAR
jgi:excisionase family DNA binding protein